MKNVAIFASGNGTNTERVIAQLAQSYEAHVAVVITNRPDAGVVAKADSAGVPVEVLRDPQDVDAIQEILRGYEIDIILLLGYLRKMPPEIVEQYKGHILNQHPALLPKYGGKGMYGRNVHTAVADAGEVESGFTLHRVSAEYDDGEILVQRVVELPVDTSAEQVERLVTELESNHVAPAIADLITNNNI